MPRTVVLANGCFDMLHIGHLRHLKAAREMGDELWVSITDDQHVLKGAGRPIYHDSDRRELVKALKCVDRAFCVSGLIEAVDFALANAKGAKIILCKGVDYAQGLHEAHENYCRKHGVEIRYTTTEKLSASEMIRLASESRRR